MKPLTSKQAAEILRLSPGYITSHLLQPGIIRAEKVNGRWQIDADAVNEYQRTEPKSTRPSVNGVNRNFVGGNGRVTEADYLENRDALDRKMAGANPTQAVYILSNGVEVSYIQWLVRCDEAKRKVIE